MRWQLVHEGPFLLGFAIPHNLTPNSVLIPFDTVRGGSNRGTVAIVIGYDDKFSIPMTYKSPPSQLETGAFLIQTVRTRFGSDNDCAWLPYDFIYSRLAQDAWALKITSDTLS